MIEMSKPMRAAGTSTFSRRAVFFENGELNVLSVCWDALDPIDKILQMTEDEKENIGGINSYFIYASRSDYLSDIDCCKNFDFKESMNMGHSLSSIILFLMFDYDHNGNNFGSTEVLEWNEVILNHLNSIAVEFSDLGKIKISFGTCYPYEVFYELHEVQKKLSFNLENRN